MKSQHSWLQSKPFTLAFICLGVLYACFMISVHSFLLPHPLEPKTLGYLAINLCSVMVMVFALIKLNQRLRHSVTALHVVSVWLVSITAYWIYSKELFSPEHLTFYAFSAVTLLSATVGTVMTSIANIEFISSHLDSLFKDPWYKNYSRQD